MKKIGLNVFNPFQNAFKTTSAVHHSEVLVV